METKPASQQAKDLLFRAERVARRNAREFVAKRRVPAPAASSSRAAEPVLPPTAGLRENGFTIFQGAFTPEECAAYSAALKAEAGIVEGTKFTKVDATNMFPTARKILFEGRVVDAVRSALGSQPRFLQVSDLHYLHDTTGWHRDSVHRAHDASAAADWRTDVAPYGIVKAIVYLESENAGMGIMSGSHASPHEIDMPTVRRLEVAGKQRVIDIGQNPNLRLSDEQRRTPLAWHAEVGDVLVFDERMYHAGRRIDHGMVTANRGAAKFTLSLVFGRDNEHSERMYSSFRYVRRDLPYKPFPPEFEAELRRHDLVLDRGLTDFYRDHPDDLRHAHLPDPSKLDGLLAEYGAQ